MKLLQTTMRNSILITIVLLIVSGIAMYYLLKREILMEMQEQLSYELDQLHKFIEQGNDVTYPLVKVEKVSDDLAPFTRYGDTLIYDPLQKKAEDYYYTVNIAANKMGNYRVSIMHTYIGWSEYSNIIFILISVTAIALVLGNVVMSYFFNKKIWSPFFNNLNSLKTFSVSAEQPLQLEDSKVTEFTELKTSLKDLADRGQKEFKALKEFTENASHEMQTPLGIIQSKLDRISQLPINEELAEHIVQAKSGVSRLKRLNKSLLLLAKLDNNAFPQKETIAVDKNIQQQLEALEELFSSKHIIVKKTLQPLNVLANPYLFEIMIVNLLSNSIRFTPAGETVAVSIADNSLIISNVGPELDFPKETLFQRFKKSSHQTDSTGLGLAIVQQICSTHEWKIDYQYLHHQHQFSIHF